MNNGNDCEAKPLLWFGPVHFATGLMGVRPVPGVYLWLAEIRGECRVVYIGCSRRDVRDRQAQRIEMILGGGLTLLDWDSPFDSWKVRRWLPEPPEGVSKSDNFDGRTWRLQQAIQRDDFRTLAHREVLALSAYWAQTEPDRAPEVERVLLEIALGERKENRAPFVYLENADLRGTRRPKKPIKVVHEQADGGVLIADLLGQSQSKT